MSRRSRLGGQLATLALVGLLVIAFPAGFALAQDLADPETSTQSNHTVLPIINLTSTPTETPTATPTETATPTPTATATPTPTSGGSGDGGGGGAGADGRRHVVDDGSGTAGGVTSEEDCSNAEYTTIQRAVDDAAPGDTVVVCGGTYPESVTIETGNLTLRSDGNAVIESTGQPAVQTTAPRVTIRGFTIRTTGAEYLIEVGGRDSLVRNNTVELTGNSTGIFLSDGLTSEGASHPTLGAATGSRVVQNTVNGSENTFSRGVWTDADQTVVRDNTLFGEDDTTSIRSSGNRTVIRDNTIRHLDSCRQEPFEPNDCHSKYRPPAILIGEPENDLGRPYPCGPPADDPPNAAKHNWARQNLVMDNTVSHAPGQGLAILAKGNHSEILTATKGLVVKHNTFFQTGGVNGWTNGALFNKNTINADNRKTGESTGGEGNAEGWCFHSHDTLISGNSIDGYLSNTFDGRNITMEENAFTRMGEGLEISSGIFSNYPRKTAAVRVINNTFTGNGRAGPALIVAGGANVSEIAYNQISNTSDHGVAIGHQSPAACGTGTTKYTPDCGGNVTKFHHNNITDNAGSGVVITASSTVTGFHHNLIDNNGNLGIHKQNFDKSDGEWPIVNATNNYWGCGGPSGGLNDPYTNRTANGSGDSISAGDEAGKSNVHFDPFLVRRDADCSSPLSTPTPTPTATATPTSTHSPTPPAGGGGTGDDGGEDGPRNGTGSGEGAGTGSGAGTGTTTGEGSGADSDASGGNSGGGETASPPPTSSATASRTPTATPPPTPTPTPPNTPTPTPAVEPGFGVLTWLIGGLLLGGLLAIRRRSNTDGARRND